MSEEEAIKHCTDFIKENENRPIILHKAISIILDLYNKEKEKNKELEKADLTIVYMNGFYDGENKWKDKIKEKFQDYSQSSLMENNTFLDFKNDLLEEDNK